MATDTGFIAPSVAAVELKPPVSWGAIWSGAAVTVAVSVVLTLAGAGLGYALSVSAIASRSSLAAFTPEVGAGAIVVQVLSAALGGYLAGRLRTIWHGVHDDEVHFRDMAHGLIAWAVATVILVVLGAALLAPYADALAGQAAEQPPLSLDDARRAASIAAQSYLFMAVGMLLSAFVAAVAGRIGGLRNEQMHQTYLHR